MAKVETLIENQLTMEIEADPEVCAETAARLERCWRNLRWLERHAEDAYSRRGKYICIAGEELFVADSPDEAIRAAKRAHPDDDGRFTLYVPLVKAPRVYAC